MELSRPGKCWFIISTSLKIEINTLYFLFVARNGLSDPWARLALSARLFNAGKTEFSWDRLLEILPAFNLEDKKKKKKSNFLKWKNIKK